MTCIYEVRYEFRWQSSEPTHWEYQTIKVAAGTFGAFRVDGEGARYHNKGTNRFTNRTWYAPEHCRRFLLREETSKATNGFLLQAERTELVYFKQA